MNRLNIYKFKILLLCTEEEEEVLEEVLVTDYLDLLEGKEDLRKGDHRSIILFLVVVLDCNEMYQPNEFI